MYGLWKIHSILGGKHPYDCPAEKNETETMFLVLRTLDLKLWNYDIYTTYVGPIC